MRRIIILYFVQISSVIFKDEVFKEEVDITPEYFFEKVRQVKQLPTSSQPTVGDLTKLYQKEAWKKNMMQLLVYTYLVEYQERFKNVYSVANSMNNINVYPYDSEMAAAGQAFLVKAAAKLAKEKRTVNEIIEKLDEIKKENRNLFYC